MQEKDITGNMQLKFSDWTFRTLIRGWTKEVRGNFYASYCDFDVKTLSILEMKT